MLMIKLKLMLNLALIMESYLAIAIALHYF
jgi:hypothetical protein